MHRSPTAPALPEREAPSPPEAFFRWDVEDFLTPAADWALEHILELLKAYGVRANFAVVGMKARALRDRGRGSWVARMAGMGAIGSHSWSHSVHPTLAEELEGLPSEAAREAFRRREAPVVAMLEGLGSAPVFFTQPGGNWVPEAITAGPTLGYRAFISEAWNSYFRPSPRPVWIGSMLVWGLPVDIPKGFLFRLPAGVEEAAASVGRAWAEGRIAGLVSHPTELVTEAFWDAQNFAGGTTRTPWVPAPARPAAAWRAALGGLESFLEQLSLHGPRWLTVHDFLTAPPHPGMWDREQLTDLVRREGLGPASSLTAAEMLYALARWQAGLEDELVVPVVGAPEGEAPAAEPVEGLVRHVDATGHLPLAIGGEPLAAVAETVLQYHGLDGVPWAFLDWVRPERELHWDWPIFAPGFRAPRLLQEARRLSWTIRLGA
jgi:hypothetical protein